MTIGISHVVATCRFWACLPTRLIGKRLHNYVQNYKHRSIHSWIHTHDFRKQWASNLSSLPTALAKRKSCCGEADPFEHPHHLGPRSISKVVCTPSPNDMQTCENAFRGHASEPTFAVFYGGITALKSAKISNHWFHRVRPVRVLLITCGDLLALPKGQPRATNLPAFSGFGFNMFQCCVSCGQILKV